MGLNQYNKFDIEVNKEEIDEVQISQFKMNFISIPSYYKKSVPNTSMKALLTTKSTQTNKTGGQAYSAKVTEQIFGLSKTEKKLDNIINFLKKYEQNTKLAKGFKRIGNEELSKTNKYFFAFSLIETIVLIGVSIWQYFYLKHLFEIKGSL